MIGVPVLTGFVAVVAVKAVKKAVSDTLALQAFTAKDAGKEGYALAYEVGHRLVNLTR